MLKVIMYSNFLRFYVSIKSLINIKFFPTYGYLMVMNLFQVKFWLINMCPLYGYIITVEKFEMFNLDVCETDYFSPQYVK